MPRVAYFPVAVGLSNSFNDEERNEERSVILLFQNASRRQVERLKSAGFDISFPLRYKAPLTQARTHKHRAQK